MCDYCISYDVHYEVSAAMSLLDNFLQLECAFQVTAMVDSDGLTSQISLATAFFDDLQHPAEYSIPSPYLNTTNGAIHRDHLPGRRMVDNPTATSRSGTSSRTLWSLFLITPPFPLPALL